MTQEHEARARQRRAVVEVAVRPSALARWLQPFVSLRYRDYRLLWLGQVSSASAQWMDQLTRGWLVYQLTGSAFLLGLVAAVRLLPLLFFGVVAGAFADRFDRKLQLILAQLTSAALNALMAVLVFSGLIQVWHIFAMELLVGCAMAFQQPARQAMLPNLVARRDLMNAVALNSGAMSVSRTLGPALAGVIVAFINIGAAYVFQGVLYLAGAITVNQISQPGSVRPTAYSDGKGASRGSLLGTLMEGFRYVFHNATVLTLLSLALIPIVLGHSYGVLMPIFAEDILKSGASGLGLLLTAPGVGAVIAVLLVASLGDFRRKGTYMLLGAILLGLSLIGFAFSPWMLPSLILLGFSGIASTGYNAISQALLQKHTPDQYRGRVMSLYLLDRGLLPVGQLTVGILGGLLGAPWAVAIMGGLCVAFALGLWLRMPHLGRLE